ncbi:MAG: chemotaxis protein CheW [Kiloniellales bacterium]|nr:chemotaxis protein CheW [Kiloniellales bacterium]
MDDLLSEFLTETNESLSMLDVEIVRLEQNPNDPELIGNIFRLMHTIKGTCGFLGLPRLESVAHAGEDVLGKVRDGQLEVTADTVSLILECLDKIRFLLAKLEEHECEPEGDDGDLIARLKATAEGPAAAPAPTPEPEPAAEPAPEAAPPVPEAAVLTVVPDPAPAEQPPEAAAPELPAPAAPAAVEAAAPATASPAEPEQAAKESSVASQSIRVNVDLLENLMTMVSELVLTRNQLLQILRSQHESEFHAPLQQLNHVVSELQEGVMKTRMQPIGNAWAKLPRIVRDIANELDKKINLVMKGAETELDRQVLELIKDPLTHMVRNSGDHGLERPHERLTAGKSEVGTVTLNAYHEGGHIIIEISDDGRGLSIEKIKQKVLKNALATEAELEGMSRKQIMQFIFNPGFSTAETVTSVSGRGVGMDVVRTNIEKIGGTIELSSEEGKGTRFLIKIPLTLAIVSALVVECGGQPFAIPQLSVVELVRASSKSEHTIERINETPVLRLRDRLLPLVNLRSLLGLPAPEGQENGDQVQGFIVVAQVGAYSFGIIVDRVFDTEEIVVKPVAPILRDLTLFSGNTILGDGSVVMILDPNGIAAATGELSVTESGAGAQLEQEEQTGEERIAMLVFRAIDEAPKAVPLSLVARIEEIELEKVENSSNRYVVQYRGQLMPLVLMEGMPPLKQEGRQPVLVFSDRGRSMGLVVDEIVDIVEDRVNVQLTGEQAGLIGSAIINGQATDVIDTSHYLTKAFHDWFGAGQRQAFGDDGQGRVLLVDDSPFFRNLLAPLLSVAGYEVTAVSGATEALALCESGKTYDVIISDIEMPKMNGFEFAQTVRQSSPWAETPMVALSSHANPRDLARGRSVGFDDYVPKTDRDALLRALEETLTHARGAA